MTGHLIVAGMNSSLKWLCSWLSLQLHNAADSDIGSLDVVLELHGVC